MKLENKTVEELKNMCRNKKISGYSKLNKQGLVNLLNNNKKVKKGGGNKSFNDLKLENIINVNQVHIEMKTHTMLEN